jgi:ABC-type dipeptide/oligopeptide/nickel transport system permease component
VRYRLPGDETEPMHRYIVNRILLTFPTLLGAAALVFVLMRLIPVTRELGRELGNYFLRLIHAKRSTKNITEREPALYFGSSPRFIASYIVERLIPA